MEYEGFDIIKHIKETWPNNCWHESSDSSPSQITLSHVIDWLWMDCFSEQNFRHDFKQEKLISDAYDTSYRKPIADHHPYARQQITALIVDRVIFFAKKNGVDSVGNAIKWTKAFNQCVIDGKIRLHGRSEVEGVSNELLAHGNKAFQMMLDNIELVMVFSKLNLPTLFNKRATTYGVKLYGMRFPGSALIDTQLAQRFVKAVELWQKNKTLRKMLDAYWPNWYRKKIAHILDFG